MDCGDLALPAGPTCVLRIQLCRVYGSPQLDALLEGSDERLQQLLAELGSAF